MPDKPDTFSSCYGCQYRGKVPGSTHSCCNYPGNKTGPFDFFNPSNLKNAIKLNIKGDPHGVNSGWFMWPVNFDPIWLQNCDGFKRKEA